MLRLGEYLLLHKNQGPKASATLFPAPGPMGKGVLVQGTLWGNLILGPTARDVHNPEHINQTSEEITGYILRKCKELVPGFDASQVIHAFAGARAKLLDVFSIFEKFGQTSVISRRARNK